MNLNNIPLETLNEAHQLFETYLSLNITDDKRFIAVFELDKDGLYHVQDLRMSDFSRIEQHKVIDSAGNESEPKQAINLTVKAHTGFNPVSNTYYYFYWKYTDSNPNNLCEIAFDDTKPIKILTPKDIVTLLYNVQMHLGHGDAQMKDQTLDTLTKQLTASDDEIFIYELLQNANDYPHTKGKPVDVEIKLFDNYLVFKHTGAEFTPKNVAALCNANDKDKTDNPDAIGYKGIGFKTVFNFNDYVYLLTDGFSFRYDADLKRKKNRIPWKITPIWMEEDELSSEYAKDFLKSKNEYRVQFALRPINHSKLREDEKSFHNILQELFVDESKILFIPNLGHVRVYLDNNSTPTYDCSRDSKNWCLSKVYDNNVDPSVTEKTNKELEEDEKNNTSRIPIKYKNFTKTGVSFACKVEERKLIPQNNAIMYCYLPAEDANWGFKFFMNSDMIPNGPRKDIEHGMELNLYLSENAGKMFYEWLKDLVESGIYDYETIFALIPNFDYCLQFRPVNKDFVAKFKDGFESVLDKPLIPDVDGVLHPINDIIYDETGITSSGIISDDEFYEFSEMDGYLPHPSLRKDEDFRKFITRYLKKFAKNNIFTLDDLKACCEESESMHNWLLSSINNGNFLNFLMYMSKEAIKDFSNTAIYIDNNNQLRKASEIFYSGDNVKQALKYLSDFIDYLPHLSFGTIAFFKEVNNKRWTEVWPSLGFKQLNAGSFVGNVLFCDRNKKQTLERLNNLDSSVRFFKYLALNPKDRYDNIEFNQLPFFNSDGAIVPCFYGHLVFYEEKNSSSKEILNESWFSKDWAYFINDAYTEGEDTEHVWNFLLDNNLVNIFESKILMAEVLCDHNNQGYIAEHTCGNIQASVSFVKYVYEHKHQMLSNTDFRLISLSVTDLSGTSSFEICNDISVFPEIQERYTHYSWVEPTWMYQLNSAYSNSIKPSFLTDFYTFLQTAFGVRKLNDKSFFYLVAKKHRVDIGKIISINKQKNIDYYRYLGQNLRTEYLSSENIASVFDMLPVIDYKGNIILRKTSNIVILQNNSQLEEVIEQSWFDKTLVTMISRDYSFTEASDLFTRFGYNAYNSNDFGGFFTKYIANSAILDTHSKINEFHHFICSKVAKLNPDQISLLKDKSVSLYGLNGMRIVAKCFGFYLMTDIDIKNEISSGMLPSINAIDNSLCDSEEMITYWKNLGNTVLTKVECCKWLRSRKQFFLDSILDNSDKNIIFWRWAKKMFGTTLSTSLSELAGLPVISFSKRDDSCLEINPKPKLWEEKLYMSDTFHKGIEAFANKYGENDYISNLYIEDITNADEIKVWREFFRSVGVKDDVKDVIRRIINDGLKSMQDSGILHVLTDQFSQELEEEWDSLKDKLKDIQVKLQNSESFVPLSFAIIPDTYDINSEPLNFIQIPMEISRDYLLDGDVRALLKKIAAVANTTVLHNRFEWMRCKIHSYLAIQDSLDSNMLSLHVRFIEAFADIYNRNSSNWQLSSEASNIKLYGKDGKLHRPEELTLGHAFNPYCDFEGHGVSDKVYLNDVYSKCCNRENLLDLFYEVLNVQMSFNKNDLQYLTQPEFCMYYWTEFLSDKSEPQDELIEWIEEGVLTDKACIPNALGIVCMPKNLYSPGIKDYVNKRISSWESKIIKVGSKSDNLQTIVSKLEPKDKLDFSDCLEYLLSSDPNDYYRTTILRWIASYEIGERERIFVKNYRESEKAEWLNGKKEPIHISRLFALSSKNCKKVSSFRTDACVLDTERVKTAISVDDLSKAIKNLGVVEINDSMLKPECDEEGAETDIIVPDIKLRLLGLIASREGVQWYDLYYRIKQILSVCKFIKCNRISYRYESLTADKEKFLCVGNTFYYVKDWQKRAFTDLVAELNEKLKLDYDIHDINDILDHDEYDDEALLEFFNDKCGDLYSDTEFINELKAVSPSLIDEIDISRIHDYEANSHSADNAEPESVTEGESKSQEKIYDPYKAKKQTNNPPLETTQSDSSSQSQKNEGGEAKAGSTSSQSAGSQNSSSSNDSKNITNSEPGTKHSSTNNTQSQTNKTERNHTSNIADNANADSQNEKPEQSSWNDRVEDKWKEASQRVVKKPQGSSKQTGDYADVISDSNNNVDNAPDDSSFLDDSPADTGYQSSNSKFDPNKNKKAKVNIQRKNTEAKNAVQKAEDQMSNVESMEEVKTYSYKWFKYLNELLLGDKAKSNGKETTIDFKGIRVLASDDLMRLELPLNEIPRWIENADHAHITIYGENTVKVDVVVVAYQETSVELKIESFNEDWCHGVYKIRFYAEASSNFFESLYLRFLQLGFEDDYDMNLNLPKDIDFIYGPPGTGKTMRVVERIHNIIEKENGVDILVLTPTNKAADVVAERLIVDDTCSPYLSRYGTTESMEIAESCYHKSRTEMDMYESTSNIVVTTAARFPYDCVMNDETPICDWPWDYIIIDEASMMDILITTYILHKAKDSMFIISGDPKQIEPIDENKIGLQNIYHMVGLNSFKNALNNYDRYPVEVLTTQHRSVAAIGNLVSKYTYDGLLLNDEARAVPKPLDIEGINIKSINIVGFKIEPFDMMYGISTNDKSTYHLYSAIFTYNMAGYLAKKITEKYPDSHYSIGIICPYRAEADAIKQMLDNKPLDTNVCTINSGTVHKFQGDECDIMFVALTPPSMNRLSDDTHINNLNIINVAMSRARDYLFFVMPYSRIENFNFQARFAKLVPHEDRTIAHCSEIEELMFGNKNFIYENTNIGCHLSVNVYYESDTLYDVRMSDDALDIKINK